MLLSEKKTKTTLNTLASLSSFSQTLSSCFDNIHVCLVRDTIYHFIEILSMCRISEEYDETKYMDYTTVHIYGNDVTHFNIHENI